ncbi:alpha/beta hydrolase [Virgisporangium aurantiacum]|uniref:Lipase n=1 Tax=Virgisporangium aurantiacum TaxID=175570 RepID=A0A8J3Z2V1_9ACTN|nr:alpha/beta hydrolase [Virgisporangium aurantiacum]GIJ56569.1 lipase [Virgisporangium aurantiacum]
MIEFIGGLTYGGPRQLFDVLRPASAVRARVVLYVHGGGWHEGDRGAAMHPWLNPLLAAHGFVTASVSYRLSGEAHWPVPLDDVRAAVRWLRVHAGEHGGDPDRIGLWGHSAGAQLAALAALTMPGEVRAVALSACPSDLRDEKIGSGNEVDRLIGGAGAAALVDASPVCHTHPAAPPFLIAHGTDDAVIAFDRGIALRDALVAAGGTVEWAPIDGAGHEWADRPGPVDGPETAGTFGARALPFFRRHL